MATAGTLIVPQGGQMKENEISETHSRRGAHEECIRNLIEEPEMGKTGIFRGKLEGNIKIHSKELWVDGIDRVSVA